MRTIVTGGAAAALALALVAAACRDVGEPFRPIVRTTTPGVVTRLTFSAADDRAPAWSANGDSIYYTTSSWEETPLSPYTILVIPADGSGPARPLLERAQLGNQLRSPLTAVAPAPDGERVAFIFVGQLLPVAPCGPGPCPADMNRPMVRLTHASLHVRAYDEVAPLADDVMLPLEFSGHSVAPDATQPGGAVTISNYHPFQLQYADHGRSFFRPSWHPDGTRVAVSDGLRILSWTIGAASAQEVPFTVDAFMPAWSPAGDWLAFAQYPRLASEFIDCPYVYNMGTHVCTERRIIHHHADPRIVLLRADYLEADTTAVSGTDPAWSPDGRYLYVTTEEPGYRIIARLEVATGVLELIDGTEGGIEPAVSPDGERLAFVRGHDIWIADLP